MLVTQLQNNKKKSIKSWENIFRWHWSWQVDWPEGEFLMSQRWTFFLTWLDHLGNLWRTPHLLRKKLYSEFQIKIKKSLAKSNCLVQLAASMHLLHFLSLQNVKVRWFFCTLTIGIQFILYICMWYRISWEKMVAQTFISYLFLKIMFFNSTCMRYWIIYLFQFLSPE